MAHSLKGVGSIDGQEMVKGRITLMRYNLRERDPALHSTDAAIVAGLRDLFVTLRKGSVGARAMIRMGAGEHEPKALAPRGETHA